MMTDILLSTETKCPSTTKKKPIPFVTSTVSNLCVLLSNAVFVSIILLCLILFLQFYLHEALHSNYVDW